MILFIKLTNTRLFLCIFSIELIIQAVNAYTDPSFKTHASLLLFTATYIIHTFTLQMLLQLCMKTVQCSVMPKYLTGASLQLLA